MAIDYKALFSSNFFTRAQVDLLTRLSELIIANGGVGGSVSDPLKADKSTIFSVGFGLTGGGDLSTNRQFAVDTTQLDARYPVITNGKIDSAVIPAQAIHDTFVVADEAAMLAITGAGKGDYAVRQDNGGTYVLGGDGNASVLANWTLLPAATGVSTFNGRSGAILPATGDYSFAMISGTPTTRAGYGITDAEGTIDNTGKTAADYWGGDKAFHTLDKTAVGLANVDNTADSAKPLGSAAAATLAASTGATLIGSIPPGTGAIARDEQTELSERMISLRSFALADGSDDTTRVLNWLNALSTNKRKGYIPAGNYTIGNVAAVGDYFDIECHPQAVFVGSAASTPMIELASTGLDTARAGIVRWHGGQFDVSARTYSAATDGIGLKLSNYAQVDVARVRFSGGTDHEAAETAGKSGSGLYLSCCDRASVHDNFFKGFVEAGLYVTGGASTGSTDDPVGTHISDNSFDRCKYGWKAVRSARSVLALGNSYDTCYIGGAAYEADTLRAARVSVQGGIFRRCGKCAINLRQQVGFVVANNVITDTGYKVDGITTIAGATDILTEACVGGEVIGNVMRKDALAAFAGTYGIKNAPYTQSATTIQPQDLNINNNHINGVDFGISETGAVGVNNRYRNNDFSSITTSFYDNIPAAFLPYGSYTPTTANTSNVAASSAAASSWRRVDRDIIVNFHFTVDPTAAGAGEISLTLPVDPGADFANDQDLLGVAYSGIAGAGAHVIADTTAGSRKARVLLFFGSDVASHTWAGTFAYRISDGSAAPPPPPPPGSDLTTDTGVLITTDTGVQITV